MAIKNIYIYVLTSNKTKYNIIADITDVLIRYLLSIQLNNLFQLTVNANSTSLLSSSRRLID